MLIAAVACSHTSTSLIATSPLCSNPPPPYSGGNLNLAYIRKFMNRNFADIAYFISQLTKERLGILGIMERLLTHFRGYCTSRLL